MVMEKQIYLIKRIWLDPMENQSGNAVGYETVGYVETQEEAEAILDTGRIYDVNDCWAIKGDFPEYKYEIIKLI